jgi:Fur family peroxide stress response transcriptional regulator
LSAQLEDAFRVAALRPTAQRFAVLQFLARTPVHATADEIYRAVNRAGPRASRATVYNSLRSLAEAGLVREMAAEGRAAQFDANLHRHHHFVCDRCRAVDDILWFDLPGASIKEALKKHEVRNYEVVFHGLCEECRQATKPNKEPK